MYVICLIMTLTKTYVCNKKNFVLNVLLWFGKFIVNVKSKNEEHFDVSMAPSNLNLSQFAKRGRIIYSSYLYEYDIVSD
jgi:hypothetical protein